MRLNRSEVIAYGMVGIPIAAVGLPFAVFMPRFYATELGLGLELTGLIFMIIRLSDVVTDPFMGILVDRYPSRIGRTRHWLIASVPVLMVAAFALYLPSRDGVSASYLFFWLLVFYVGFTMLQTPHQAWVPALTNDYDARSQYFMWRQIFISGSLLVLLLLPTVLAIVADADSYSQVALMGWLLILSLPLTVGLAVWKVRDPRLSSSVGPARPKLNFLGAVGLLRDGAMARILTMEVLIGLAIAATGSTYLFAAEWGFGVTDGASAILMLYFLSGLVCMPFWLKLAERTEKHTTLVYMCVYATFAHLIYLPLSALNAGIPILIVAAVLSGAPFGAPVALLRSMMADVSEQSLVKTGADSSGLSFALLTSAFKTGQSFAIGIPFVLLGLFAGFDPVGDNSPEAVRNLMLIFAGVPAVAYAAAALTARNYPLTRAVQSGLRSVNDAK